MSLRQLLSRRPDPLHIGWSVGTLGVSLLLNTFNAAVLFFLVTALKIDPFIAGGLITGSKLYDAFTDPLMGTISDRTRSRWGRRRPYLLLGGITSGLAFAALFAIPPDLEPTTLYVAVGVALVVLATAYTIFNVPYLAMPAEMTVDYHERSVMMSYRVFLIAIGTFLSLSGVPALLAWAQASLGYSPAEAHRLMGVIVGTAMAVAMVGSFFGTRGARATERTPDSLTAGQRLRLMLNNRPFLLFLGIKLTSLFSLASITATQFFFVVYVMQQSVGIAAIFGTAQLLGQFIGIPAWLALAKQRGKTWVLIWSTVGMAVMALTWLAAGPDEPLWVYGARGVLLGLASAGNILGTQAILPDIMEYDYRRTGLRREGVFAGMASFIEKTAGALTGVVIGGFLSAMDFDKAVPPGQQPDSALFAIMACTSLIPLSMHLAKLALLWFYDLSAEKLQATVRVT
ncbi:MAG: MFS transporter [Chromatiales bacterium]|nr:MFS transporter [Chromatiales bacterium]